MNKVRFGPSGTTKTLEPLEALEYMVNNFPELKAFEIPFTMYQYQLPSYSTQYMESFQKTLKKHEIYASCHAPFTISLTNSKQFHLYGKKRLLKVMKLAKRLGCNIVVIHPGGYQEGLKKEDHIKLVAKHCKEILNEIQSIDLGLETTGKHKQFGKLEELISVAQQVDKVRIVLDWAHIHARNGGILKSVDDVIKVLLKLENTLGKEALKNLHMHFTGVEFTIIQQPTLSLKTFLTGKKEIIREGSEKKHLPINQNSPDPKLILKAIKEFNVSGTMICESPLREKDAIQLLKMYETL